MKISRAAEAIETSFTRKLFNLAKQYNDVVDFTLGDPDVLPPEKIRKAACEAIMEGHTRYSVNAGLRELRIALSKNFAEEFGVAADPDTEMVVTVGGMEALFLAVACLVDEGDEVIIQAPYYVNYVQMVRMCGGVPVIVNTCEENGFSFSGKQIKAAVTPLTAAMIINTPCNPTGEILGAAALDELAEIAVENDITVISDEVYRSLVFEGEADSIIKRPGMKEHSVIVDSLSKRFAMTGYRVGYAVAPAELIAAMTRMQENVAACAPLPSQYAAISAYTECLDMDDIKREYMRRRDIVYKAVNSIEGLSCHRPPATFYMFVNISRTGLGSVDFAYRLLEERHVAVAPGMTYGSAYDSYIRIAYTLSDDKLAVGIERLRGFVSNLLDEKKEQERS